MAVARSLIRPDTRFTLPDALDKYDRENERQTRRAVEAKMAEVSSTWAANLAALPRPYLYAEDYGIVGNGDHDDSDGLEAALADVSANGQLLYCGKKIVTISRAMAISGGGLIFDVASFGNVGDPGIYVTGTGYTALTVSGIVMLDSTTVYAEGQAVNGVLNSNATFSQFRKLRVVNFNGYCWKINDLWDCSIMDCSCELGGNATDYMFSMQSALSDTCNMSHIGRLQCERANKKAIFIDPATLSCVFDNIHSEQATADAAYNTWDIGAARSVFNGGRYHANNPASAKISLHGENTVIHAYNAQDMGVQVDGSSGQRLCLIQSNFNGSTVSVNTANHSGPILMIGGDLGNVSTGLETTYEPALTIIGAGINTLTVGDVGNPGLPERFLLEKCKIATLASSSTNSAALLEDCTTADLGTGLAYLLKIVRGKTTVHSGGSTLAGSLLTDSAHIVGNLTINGGETLIAYGRSVFEGNLACAGSASILGADCIVTGTPTGLSVAPTAGPNVHVQLPSNNWPRGQKHWDPVATSAAPPGYACTAAGAPGTWKAMAVLA